MSPIAFTQSLIRYPNSMMLRDIRIGEWARLLGLWITMVLLWPMEMLACDPPFAFFPADDWYTIDIRLKNLPSYVSATKRGNEYLLRSKQIAYPVYVLRRLDAANIGTVGRIEYPQLDVVFKPSLHSTWLPIFRIDGKGVTEFVYNMDGEKVTQVIDDKDAFFKKLQKPLPYDAKRQEFYLQHRYKKEVIRGDALSLRDALKQQAGLGQIEPLGGKQVQGDHRPENVKIPDSDRVDIIFYRQNRIHIANVVARYSLNANYNPRKRENLIKQHHPCAGWKGNE